MGANRWKLRNFITLMTFLSLLTIGLSSTYSLSYSKLPLVLSIPISFLLTVRGKFDFHEASKKEKDLVYSCE